MQVWILLINYPKGRFCHARLAFLEASRLCLSDLPILGWRSCKLLFCGDLVWHSRLPCRILMSCSVLYSRRYRCRYCNHPRVVWVMLGYVLATIPGSGALSSLKQRNKVVAQGPGSNRSTTHCPAATLKIGTAKARPYERCLLPPAILNTRDVFCNRALHGSLVSVSDACSACSRSKWLLSA